MPRKRRTVVLSKFFSAQFERIREKHPRATEFLDGLRFVLERDPTQGYKWGSIWTFGSVGARGLPVMTVFYTFDEETVTLQSIIEIGLM